MNRTGFILILLVVALVASLPVSVLAEKSGPLSGTINMLEGVIKAQAKKLEQNRANATLLMQLAREICQQRADVQAEVLFWFRTHPNERIFPQKEVDRMLNIGGYYPAAVEGLTGSRTPFFVDSPRGE